MKSTKKFIMLLAVVLVLTLAIPSALAVNDTAVEAGKTATLTFTFSDIYNVDGTFTVTDPDNIVSSHSIKITDAGATAAAVSGDRLWASPSAEPIRTTVVVKVSVTLRSSAKAGATCTVSFQGIYGDADEAPGNEHDVTQSATVMAMVVPSSNASSSPNPSSSPSPSPSPSSSVDDEVDYTELQEQIDIAKGMDLSSYEDSSRVALANALAIAQNALDSNIQNSVDAAARQLRRVMEEMQKVDYSQLQAALDKADLLLVSEQTAVLWELLYEASMDGESLLSSGDQRAVDAAATRLEELIVQLEEELQEIRATNEEVPVATLPTDDFCNMSGHRVWIVVCGISLALNAALIALVVLYVVKKVKNRKDDTPLVDYDIDLDEEI